MVKIDPDGPPEEVQVFAAQYCDGPPHWTPLPGGRSNRSWRLRTGHCDRVFKLFDRARANLLFPNDAQAEVMALEALSGTDLAPELQRSFSTRTGPCLVYQFLPGEPIQRMDAATMRALGRLHRLKPPPTLRRVSISPTGLLRQGQSFLASLDRARVRSLAHLAPDPKNIPPGPDVFLHGDPVPANVLPFGHERCLIDWQCPAIGDATADLAIALSPAMHHVYGCSELSAQACEEALKAYPETRAIARYRALKPFYQWRMAAYCAWKAAQGETIYEQAAEAELSQIPA